MKKYTVDYFIKKFRAIPDKKWIMEEFIERGKCCVLGHCGVRWDKNSYFQVNTKESNDLDNLFLSNLGVYPVSVNDNDIYDDNDNFIGPTFDKFFGDTPRERILVALENIKYLEEV